MEQEIQLNAHNKQEYPPMHTAEHILNQTMVRMFGCPRSKNAHIEKKKSKCDYILPVEPEAGRLQAVENQVNKIIAEDLPVRIEYLTRDRVPEGIDLSKLPQEAGETLRIVRIGEYDVCACIGQHVSRTSEIGKFRIISTDYQAPVLRIRFKLEG